MQFCGRFPIWADLLKVCQASVAWVRTPEFWVSETGCLRERTCYSKYLSMPRGLHSTLARRGPEAHPTYEELSGPLHQIGGWPEYHQTLLELLEARERDRPPWV